MNDQDLSGLVLNGRYRLGERLGAGGWGSVYAAVQIDLGRPVAIKVLHKDVALASDGLLRFEREAKSAAALGHPNIAQVSDFQANPGEPPFLVMELLTGTTLGYKLREETEKLPTPRMAWIAYQILAGLDVAHRAGIVHRDIKPDNVFLVAMPGVEDYVKLLDFGIAKLAGDASSHITTTGTMLGSPAFMAPEQVKTNDVDHRVDIYAVGATMYLALAGKMPFNAPNVHGLLLAITEQRAVPLHVLDPSIDPAMSALVERAMHKDREGRFASAAQMRGALEPWLGGAAAHASATANGPRMVGAGANVTAAIASVAPATAPGAYTTGPAGAPMGPPLGTPPPGPASSPWAPSGSNVSSQPSPYGAPPSPAFGAPHAVTPYGSPPAASASPYGGPQSPYMMTPAVQPSSHTPAPAPAPAKGGGAVIGLLAAVVVLLLVLVGGGIAAFVHYSGSSSGGPVANGTGPGGVVGLGATAPPATVAANGAPAVPAVPGAPGVPGAVGGAAPRAGALATPATPATPAPGAKGIVAAQPGVAPAPGAPVAIVTDAGAAGAAAPVAKKQFAGSGFRIGGGSFGVFEIDPAKAAIMRNGGAISGCFAATEFDPPDHQFTDWVFQVDPAGNVKSVRRATDFQPHPKFDACMAGALRQVKFAATASGGSPQVNFTSRTRDNP